MSGTTQRLEASTADYENLYGPPRPRPAPPQPRRAPRRRPSVRGAREVVILLDWVAVLVGLTGVDVIIWAAIAERFR